MTPGGIEGRHKNTAGRVFNSGERTGCLAVFEAPAAVLDGGTYGRAAGGGGGRGALPGGDAVPRRRDGDAAYAARCCAYSSTIACWPGLGERQAL